MSLLIAVSLSSVQYPRCGSVTQLIMRFPFHISLYPDHYELLGIDQQASEEDIKTAFKKRAKEEHPDVSDEVRESSSHPQNR